MSRNVSFAPGEFYHLYNRGVDKRNIFTDTRDYTRMITQLYVCNGTRPVELGNANRKHKKLSDFDDEVRGDTLVDIAAYCLMPNHFHILVKEKDGGGISKFMQKLCTGYTMYFNKRHERSGALFQGKFKAEHADSNEYLKYLFSYIHLNPIKLVQSDWKECGLRDVKAAADYLQTYSPSSYLDYTKVPRPESKIITPSEAPVYFSTIAELDKEMRDWLTFTEVEPR